MGIRCRLTVRSNVTPTQVDEDTLNSEPISVLELSAESHPEFVSKVVVVVCE